MKELSIEEKAKAYDEARKKIAIRFGSNVADEIFSQFEMSEDERIRKEIINYFKCQSRDEPSRKDIHNKWIAWLEKQGEQKSEHTTDFNNHDTWVNDPVITFTEVQSEQKPTEYEKPLLEKFKQAVYDCAWGKVTCKVEGESQEEYANRWAEHWLMLDRAWADDYIDNKEDVIDRRAYDKGEQEIPNSAWSEEDETLLNTIIDNVEGYDANTGCIALKFDFHEKKISWLKSIKDRVQPKQEWSEEDEKYWSIVIAEFSKCAGKSVSKDEWMRCNDWLNSLRDIVQPQPKQEWSEEDEQLYNDLSDTYFYNDEDYPEETYKLMLKRVLDWMTKRAKSLRPQSQWKPSNMELEVLRLAAEKDGTCLMGLYEQLKKLREE